MGSRVPERRSSERYPTDLKGWFAHETSRQPVACTVWDLSRTGVRLLISEPADVPLEFELHIPSAGAAANVRLVWTSGVHYGARFTD